MNNLEKVCLLLLKPIAKFFLAKGLKYSQIDELMQRALVEESTSQVQLVNKELSVSKIALISGVHRKRTKEIIESKNPDLEGQSSILSKVVGIWCSNSKYLDKNNKPKTLSIVGVDSEFSNLVSSVTKQISPYTVLFELKRIGTIHTSESEASLVNNEYWTGSSDHETYALVAQNIEDILSSVDENLKNNKNDINQLHLTTFYDNIEEESIPKIKKWFLLRGSEIHKECREYISKFDKDVNNKLKGEGGGKVSFTTISFSSPKLLIQEIKPNKRGRKKKNV